MKHRTTPLCFCMTAFSKRKPNDHTTQWSVTQSLPLNWLSDSQVVQESFPFSSCGWRHASILWVHVHLTANTNLNAPEPIWVGEEGLHL